MQAFTYTLPAVRGTQAGREYFTTMCPLRLVPVLFRSADDAKRPELQLQRALNKARIPEIARYIAKHPRTYILSSLTASIDGDVTFEPSSGAEGAAAVGFLRVPMSARLLLHDGLHRGAAIEAALKLRPELAEETISLLLYVDPGLRRAEQMFTDLKRNETRSARSGSIACDHRDEMARLVKAVIGRVPVFAALTEMVRSTISNRSLKLFTFSGIYHATTILLSGRQEKPFSANVSLAAEFWSTVAKHIPDWNEAQERRASTSELRKRSIHAHALALAALARAGKSLLELFPAGWEAKLGALATLDWSRSNTQLWEGRAMIAGRLSKAHTCVVLTGNVIKRHVGLRLTAEEEELEARLSPR